MTSRKVSILVVDDDVRILRMIRRILELEGYRVLIASNGEAALDVFCEGNPNLVLLDIMLPGIDGYAVCRGIREFSQIPIIMVTAKSNEEEKVQGLEAGADDYVTKPFSSAELAARVRAVLRRSRVWDKRPEPAFHYNDIEIDFAAQRVTLDSQEINLTATEYRLISYLARNAGRVVTPDQILENVWNEEYLGETHLLQVNMARLRQKLKEDTRDSRYILTKPVIGYTMAKKMLTR